MISTMIKVVFYILRFKIKDIQVMGSFDFDGALFPDLYDNKGDIQHRNYVRYYISDHRIKWIEITP